MRPTQALMDGCKRKLHALCCHWFATSAAFTAKVAAWPAAQADGNGRRRPLVTLPKCVQKPSMNETELNNVFVCGQIAAPLSPPVHCTVQTAVCWNLTKLFVQVFLCRCVRSVAVSDILCVLSVLTFGQVLNELCLLLIKSPIVKNNSVLCSFLWFDLSRALKILLVDVFFINCAEQYKLPENEGLQWPGASVFVFWPKVWWFVKVYPRYSQMPGKEKDNSGLMPSPD